MPLTLHGNDMNKYWFEAVVPCLGQGYFQFRDIVGINRPHIG